MHKAAVFLASLIFCVTILSFTSTTLAMYFYIEPGEWVVISKEEKVKSITSTSDGMLYYTARRGYYSVLAENVVDKKRKEFELPFVVYKKVHSGDLFKFVSGTKIIIRRNASKEVAFCEYFFRGWVECDNG